MRFLLPLLFLAPSLAVASEDIQILNCQIEGSKNHLILSHNEGDMIYQFGPKGAPDLMLSEPKDSFKHTPWSGVGRAIWEAAAFENKGYIYEVWMAFDRHDAIENPDKARSAGVTVYKDGNDLATHHCQQSDLEFFAFSIDDAINRN